MALPKRFPIKNEKDMKAAVAKLKGDHDLMIFDGKWWIYDDSSEFDKDGFFGIGSGGEEKEIKYKDIEFAEIN